MTVTPSAISLPAAQIYTDCASDLNHLITLLSAGTKFGLSFVLFAVTFLSFLSFCRPHEAPSVAPPQRNHDDRRVVVFSFPGL